MKTFYNITLIFVILYSNNALENIDSFKSCTLGRVQELSNTIQELSCERYVASGYKYEKPILINSFELDNLELIEVRSRRTFTMNLAIKAAMDAKLLLSHLESPGNDDLVFEISVGQESNRYTTLRLSKNRPAEHLRVHTPGVMSASRYTHFYITVSDTSLRFGKRGESTPLISYDDEMFLKSVKYFGMSSSEGQFARFLYDCPENKPRLCYHRSGNNTI